MRMHEIMTEHVQTVPPDTSLAEAYGLMRAHRIHHLVVRDASKIAGIVSAKDLPPAVTADDGHVVREVMSLDVVNLDENDTVRRAANLMRGRNVGCVVVTRNGALAGIVTVSDLLELLGKGHERPARAARANLHHRVPHVKQHGRRSW